MDKAPVYGTGDSRFDPWQGRTRASLGSPKLTFYLYVRTKLYICLHSFVLELRVQNVGELACASGIVTCDNVHIVQSRDCMYNQCRTVGCTVTPTQPW